VVPRNGAKIYSSLESALADNGPCGGYVKLVQQGHSQAITTVREIPAKGTADVSLDALIWIAWRLTLMTIVRASSRTLIIIMKIRLYSFATHLHNAL